jgi:predicted short-subunit dehydrogenase-like oxidoreductase (DUF2520 family)
MRVVIIGTGNVATVLGRKMLAAEHDIVQVCGRSALSAKELAVILNTDHTDRFDQVNRTADIYVIAVADTAIEEVAAALHLDKKLVVHTAGSISKEVLKKCSSNYGILYPVQSLRKEMTMLPEIPFMVDGNTAEDLTLISDFAKTFSGNVQIANDEQRLRLHVAAVIVSNFTNHLYALAEEYCKREQVDFTMLLPLIAAIANRLYEFSPRDVQTGPAIRGDEVTIQKHLELLQGHPALKKFYEMFSDSIRDTHH